MSICIQAAGLVWNALLDRFANLRDGLIHVYVALAHLADRGNDVGLAIRSLSVEPRHVIPYLIGVN